MEIKELIKSLKEIYTALLQFIETDDSDSEFKELVTIFEIWNLFWSNVKIFIDNN